MIELIEFSYRTHSLIRRRENKPGPEHVITRQNIKEIRKQTKTQFKQPQPQENNTRLQRKSSEIN